MRRILPLLTIAILGAATSCSSTDSREVNTAPADGRTSIADERAADEAQIAAEREALRPRVEGEIRRLERVGGLAGTPASTRISFRGGEISLDPPGLAKPRVDARAAIESHLWNGYGNWHGIERGIVPKAVFGLFTDHSSGYDDGNGGIRPQFDRQPMWLVIVDDVPATSVNADFPADGVMVLVTLVDPDTGAIRGGFAAPTDPRT